MRIIYSDTYTGEDCFVDVPDAEFGPQAVNVALSKAFDPEGDWQPKWHVVAWEPLSYENRTACFIMRDVEPTHDAMLIHGVVHMRYDPDHVPPNCR